MPAARGRFATTRWSVVLAASDGDSPTADEALAKLYETYYYPLYGYLRGRGQDVSDAEDLTQAFFAQLLEKKVLRHADPARGRFRSFLLKSLQNFVANDHDRRHAKKRAPAAPLLPLDFGVAEERYGRWAQALLECTLTR